MYEELKQRVLQVIEANRTVKAKPSIVLLHVVNEVFSDENFSKAALLRVCGLNEKSLYRNTADFKAIAELLSNCTTQSAPPIAGVQPSLHHSVCTTQSGVCNEEKEKAEKKGSPQTPLKETRKEKEKLLPPKSPTEDLEAAAADRAEKVKTLPAVLANIKAEVLGEDPNRYETRPTTPPKSTKYEDEGSQVTPENEMPDHEHYLAFMRAYPKKTDFRYPKFTEFQEAWRTAISHGFRGEHLVQAVEAAKQTSDWRSPDGGWRFTPGAINFLNEEQALNYLPRSYDPEANLKKDAPKKVKWADVELSI